MILKQWRLPSALSGQPDEDSKMSKIKADVEKYVKKFLKEEKRIAKSMDEWHEKHFKEQSYSGDGILAIIESRRRTMGALRVIIHLLITERDKL